jgi:hypothetical protein
MGCGFKTSSKWLCLGYTGVCAVLNCWDFESIIGLKGKRIYVSLNID